MTRARGVVAEGALGCSLRGGVVAGQVRRIVAIDWLATGRRSTEFYLAGGELIHVYETFEYFAEDEPAGAWRNFKGLAAWERRLYFDGDAVGYAERRGHGAALATHSSEESLATIERARRLLEALAD